MGEGREMPIESLRSCQLPHKKRKEFFFFIGEAKWGGGGEGEFHWAGLPQLPVHRSQWKFIFLIGHISFRVRLDSMLKLIRNYINPNGFAVWDWFICSFVKYFLLKLILFALLYIAYLISHPTHTTFKQSFTRGKSSSSKHSPHRYQSHS